MGVYMEKLKVMLVDDEITILEGFKWLFDWEKHGCIVICEAEDGVMAINYAKIYEPDIIIMDINIPIISGLDAIRIIQDMNPNISFIIMSGYDEFEYCREALRLRITDYMLKPVNYSELGIVVNRLKMELLHEKMNINEKLLKEGVIENNNLIFQMTAFIQERLAEEINLQKLSEEFHLNPGYISKVFKNKTGINYHAYLTKLRINKAEVLLNTTDKNITEIAAAVGFKDYRVFTKVFKKHTGKTPSQYSNKINNNHVKEQSGS